MGFPRQEHWSVLPFTPPGALPYPEIEPSSLMSPVLANRFFTTSATWEDSEMYFVKDEIEYECYFPPLLFQLKGL